MCLFLNNIFNRISFINNNWLIITRKRCFLIIMSTIPIKRWRIMKEAKWKIEHLISRQRWNPSILKEYRRSWTRCIPYQRLNTALSYQTSILFRVCSRMMAKTSSINVMLIKVKMGSIKKTKMNLQDTKSSRCLPRKMSVEWS